MKNNDEFLEKKIAAAQYIEERDYWLNKLSDPPGKSIFPVDHRTSIPPGVFAGVEFSLEGALFSRLSELSKGSLYTQHIILLAGLTALVRRYTGAPDTLLGTPVYRQDTAGDLLNTALVIRNRSDEEMTFKDLLIMVKQTVVEAAQHPAYPVEILPEMLNMPDSGDGFPLFDIVLLITDIQKKGDILHLGPNIIFTFTKEDRHFAAKVEFNPAKYETATVEQIALHFTTLLSKALDNMDSDISGIDILSPAEKKRLTVEFNDTAAGYPRDKTIHRLFEERAERAPDAVALNMSYRTNKTYNTHMTYSELNRRAGRLASLLWEKGVRPDTPVGITVERSFEMIVGILGILKACGVYMPIDPGYPEERKRYMLADSGAALLLTARDINGCREQACLFHDRTDANNLAYIIYTSGSTGKPRGVLVSHRNVVRLLFNDRCLFDFSSRDVWTMFHSFCFDFSVWEMYGALLYGGRLVIVPEMVVRDFPGYLKILKKQAVTVLNQTPSAFYNLMDLELNEPLKHLNTRYVIFGGEALSPSRLKKWKAAYPQTRLINMYGITETTVHVTFKELGETDIDSGTSNVGKPIPTLSVYITDRHLNLQPIGVAGELCVSGAGLARGYLNNPDRTAEKFNRSYRTYKSYKTHALYKSGDLGRWLPNGDIEYLGRIDLQVKIRGYRIELGEIETRLLSHPGVKETVVVPRGEKSGDNYLCAYVVPDGATPSPDLEQFLSQTLPGYMIPAYFVPLEKIPLTANGKVDRKALPDPLSRASAAHTPPRTAAEKTLTRLWSDILGIPGETIGMDSHFFRLGGHSLKAVKLAAGILKRFSVHVPIHEIFNRPTVGQLADYIEAAGKETAADVEPAEKREYYPISSMQKRLYILDLLENVKTAYNMGNVFFIEGEPDPPRFQQIFQQLIRRHESLRTSFAIIDDQPVQIVHENVDFHMDCFEAGESERQRIVKEFVTPFDLSRAPLLRARLVKFSTKKYLFLYDMHHIVSDGVSLNLFIRDFSRLYEGKGDQLPGLPIQYKDFSQWRNNLRGGARGDFEKKENYWLDRFKGEIPKLEIFTDYPRPPIQSFQGERIWFFFEEDLCERIRRFIKETDTTLYMFLLAVYTTLLSKYTGQEDIVVGTPIAGRELVELENTIGLFINSLPMRNYPRGNKAFADFLDEVKSTTIDAYENQAYPFGDLMEKVAVIEDLSRNPIFEAELLVHNMDEVRWEIEGLTFTPYEEYVTDVTQSDIALGAMESGERILFDLSYSTALFKRATLERFVEFFRELASGVLDNPGIKLGEIEVVPNLRSTKSGIYRETKTDFDF